MFISSNRYFEQKGNEVVLLPNEKQAFEPQISGLYPNIKGAIRDITNKLRGEQIIPEELPLSIRFLELRANFPSVSHCSLPKLSR